MQRIARIGSNLDANQHVDGNPIKKPQLSDFLDGFESYWIDVWYRGSDFNLRVKLLI